MANNFNKRYQKANKASNNALYKFESTVDQLEKNNEELALIHTQVEEEIERLVTLKESTLERISQNNNAISGIKQIMNGV